MIGTRKTKPIRSGYAKLLAILLSIAIIPGLLISALAYFVSIDNAKKQAVTYSTQYLDLIVESNAAILQQSKSIIFELMLNYTSYSDILRQPRENADTLQLLQSLEKKKLASAQYVKSFYFIDNRSGKIYASDRSAIYAMADFPDSNLVKLVEQPNEKLVFNDLFERQTSSGEHVASYVAGYPLTGDKLGYLVIDLDMDRFAAPSEDGSQSGGHLLVLNRHGQLVNTGQSEWLAKVQDDPKDFVVIRKASNEAGLSYQYVIPKHLLSANNRILLDSIVAICFVFILLEAAAAWFSSNKLYTPLRNLLQYIQQLVGDQSKRPEGEDEYYYVREIITNMNVQNKDYLDTFQANSNLFKQRQLRRLLNGEASAAQTMLVPDSLRLQFPYSHYLVLMLEIDEPAEFRERYTVLEQELMLYAITNIAEEVLSAYGIAAAAPTDNDRLAIVFNHAPGERPEPPVYEAYALQIQTQVNHYLKISLSIGIGQTCARQADIPQSHEQAHRALVFRIYYGKGSILSYGKLPEQPHSERHIVSWNELRTQLKAQLQAAEWEPIEAMLNGWVSKLTYPGMTQADLQLCFLQYAACLSDLCGEFSVDYEELTADGPRLNDVVRQTIAVSDLNREMLALARKLHERIRSTKDHIHQELIQHLLQYIREHLDQDLTLESLAEKVYMHPAYLSRICKSLTGKGLGEQIVLARIERAKELLLGTGQSVNDISVQLGYTNPRAFYRLFKEYTSMTPGEFRKNAGLRNVK
ncbi:helix-turn-helix transcriptional regulator [Paenibacillus lycopersici]|uniref:Helix-turn-helix transcriptional regulator n=1 Tax=Paenibacillus lycopersici TaxID=2704462 RepID=A0A6C0FYZ6_9BACL|nr:helix-turn-helix domain-containing protein [Paenibacillus lycopersici]QHT62326.1 helix-turn-helix transcriptional regulator [Paenibacillus lycopersici]